MAATVMVVPWEQEQLGPADGASTLAAAKPAVPADALASTGGPCKQPIFVELDGTTAPCSPAPRDEHGVEQAD
jgi:hypothetical protein